MRTDGSVLFQEMVGSKRGNWEESNMILAINKVRNKEMSIRQASDHFSVPKSSLGDRLKALAAGKEVKLRPCVDNSGTFQKTFTNDQDTELYNHIKALDSQLMPLNKKDFLKLAYNFAERLKINHRCTKKMCIRDSCLQSPVPNAHLS